MATAVFNPLPEAYVELSDQELDDRIARARAELGSPLVILGHHYQRDEVVKFADYRGDSLKLSQLAASHPEAEYICSKSPEGRDGGHEGSPQSRLVACG